MAKDISEERDMLASRPTVDIADGSTPAATRVGRMWHSPIPAWIGLVERHRTGWTHLCTSNDGRDDQTPEGRCKHYQWNHFTRWQPALLPSQMRGKPRKPRYCKYNGMRQEIWVSFVIDGGLPPRGQPVVYLLYDDPGELMYVGSTIDLPARLRTHGREKPSLFRRATDRPRVRPDYFQYIAYACLSRDQAYDVEDRLLRRFPMPPLNRRRAR